MSIATLRSNRFHVADLGSVVVKCAILLALAAVVGVIGYASLETSLTHSI